MDALCCFPDPLPASLVEALEAERRHYRVVADAAVAEREEPEDGWAGAVIAATGDLERALALARALRKRDDPVAPILLVVPSPLLDGIAAYRELFDDFCVLDARSSEIRARLSLLVAAGGEEEERHEVIAYGPLALNLETYQAVVEGRPLDLTYMEYELLRFLAGHPGKVFTREVLLSRVWGYEYFGGARTVDVHVRRLRAKLGEEHANLIETVRSVGYRFGKARWTP